jgi:hypothetical protein
LPGNYLHDDYVHHRDRSEKELWPGEDLLHAIKREEDAKYEERRNLKPCSRDGSLKDSVNDASSKSGSHTHHHDCECSGWCEDWDPSLPVGDDPHHQAAADAKHNETHKCAGDNGR